MLQGYLSFEIGLLECEVGLFEYSENPQMGLFEYGGFSSGTGQQRASLFRKTVDLAASSIGI